MRASKVKKSEKKWKEEELKRREQEKEDKKAAEAEIDLLDLWNQAGAE